MKMSQASGSQTGIPPSNAARKSQAQTGKIPRESCQVCFLIAQMPFAEQDAAFKGVPSKREL
jgi:hypothetical protein